MSNVCKGVCFFFFGFGVLVFGLGSFLFMEVESILGFQNCFFFGFVLTYREGRDFFWFVRVDEEKCFFSCRILDIVLCFVFKVFFLSLVLIVFFGLDIFVFSCLKILMEMFFGSFWEFRFWNLLDGVCSLDIFQGQCIKDIG